jgi:hypothetical protein
MCALPFSKVYSIPTVIRYRNRNEPAAFSSRQSPIACGITSSSWCSHSAASRTPEPGQHRDGSLDSHAVAACTTAPKPTSSISVCQVWPHSTARKVAKYDATGGGRPMRFVHRIEPAGTEEAVCIQVAAEDSLYVTEDFLLTHNTLNDAFIILDEAQNTTGEQMKMFLTRLGFGSKVVVTGDITQVDLPGGATSGLRAAMHILDGIDDIHFAELTSADVVRHRLSPRSSTLRQIRRARADEPGPAPRVGRPTAKVTV